MPRARVQVRRAYDPREPEDGQHVAAYDHLKALARHGRLTLLTATKRSDISEAAVLAELLNR